MRRTPLNTTPRRQPTVIRRGSAVSDADGEAAAAADDADSATAERRQQARTAQRHRRPVGPGRRADGARAERRVAPPLAGRRPRRPRVGVADQFRVGLGVRARDVERVALAVAEPVQYPRANTAVLSTRSHRASSIK